MPKGAIVAQGEGGSSVAVFKIECFTPPRRPIYVGTLKTTRGGIPFSSLDNTTDKMVAHHTSTINTTAA